MYSIIYSLRKHRILNIDSRLNHYFCKWKTLGDEFALNSDICWTFIYTDYVVQLIYRIFNSILNCVYLFYQVMHNLFIYWHVLFKKWDNGFKTVFTCMMLFIAYESVFRWSNICTRALTSCMTFWIKLLKNIPMDLTFIRKLIQINKWFTGYQ